jgi:VanZ family protein
MQNLDMQAPPARKFGRSLLIILLAILLVLIVIPMPEQMDRIPYLDKIGHWFYLYTLATVLGLHFGPWRVILIGVGISIGIEAFQYFIPWRNCSAVDAYCAIAGTATAVLLYRIRAYRKLLAWMLW